MRSLLLALAVPVVVAGQRSDSARVRAEIEQRATAVTAKAVAWRRDIHEHPELSYQEVRTAKIVADHLRALGLEVRAGVGGNGVVAVLRGGKPGGVVAMRADIHARVKRTAEDIAASAGLTADVSIPIGYPITVNDSTLFTRMLPTLGRAAGTGNVQLIPKIMAGEDFTRFATAAKAPAMFVTFGVTPKDKDWRAAGPNHSTTFNPSEAAIPLGVRTYALLARDFLANRPAARP
jgi:metal-dependent amidase/aminoacylase/carboxypeptidase family protein